MKQSFTSLWGCEILTGPLGGSMPAAALCRRAGCDHLQRKGIRVGHALRMVSYCSVTDKIPGNMARCPLE